MLTNWTFFGSETGRSNIFLNTWLSGRQFTNINPCLRSAASRIIPSNKVNEADNQAKDKQNMSEAAHGVLSENGYRPNRNQNNYSQSQHVVTSECQSADAWDTMDT